MRRKTRIRFTFVVLLILLLWLFPHQTIVSLTVGSNHSVSRQTSMVVFPAEDSGYDDDDDDEGCSNNLIRGFTVLEKGFKFENSATTCTYDAFMPIAGDVLLNGGTLHLKQDLKLSNPFRLLSGGSVVGNHRSIEFPITCAEIGIPFSTKSHQLVQVASTSMNRDVLSADWSFDDAYVAAGSKNTSGKELKVYYFNGNLLTTTAQAELGDNATSVRWHPSEHYLAVGRRRDPGDEVRIYELNSSNGSFTKTDGVEIGRHVEAVSWHPNGDVLAAGLSAGYNEIRLYSFNAGNLTSLTSENISPSRWVGCDALDWDVTGSYLAVGLSYYYGGSTPELLVYHFDGSTLTLTAQHNIDRSVTALDWSPSGTFLAVGLASGSERFRVYEHIISNGSFSEKTAARIGETKRVNALDWAPDGNSVLLGRDCGAGSELRLYTFDKTTHQMLLVADVVLSTDVNTARFSRSGMFAVSGDDHNDVIVYGGDQSVIFENVALEFNSPISFDTTIVFSGDSCIEGNGNTLDLTKGTSIIIAEGSSLRFVDVFLDGLGSGFDQLIFTTGSSKVYFSNVDIALANDVTTSVGGVIVDGPTTWILKDHNWTFDQAGSLTIDGVSLILDPAGKATAPGDVLFGSPQANHFSLLRCGTIKKFIDISITLSISQELMKQNSNQILELLDDIAENSSAIVTLQQTGQDLVQQNSSQILSILDDIAANSNQILATNELTIGNSDQILTTSQLSIQNSAMIITHSDRLDHNSNKIISNMNTIMENSNQILQTIEDVVGNSNQVLTTNALAVGNSDQLLTTSALSIQNSAMIIAHSERIDQNSNQLVVVNQLSIDNSNAITVLQGATSVLAEQNSNQILSMLDDIASNSNQALTTNALSVQSSNQIIENLGDIEANSNQILTTSALSIQNSAMIITHSDRLDHNSNKIISNMNTIMENSNQILQTIEDVVGNSNQILDVRVLAVANSDQILTTSALSIQNSAMIITHGERIDQNSNQLIVVNQLSIDNSNAITVLQGATSVLAEQNSNQILSMLDDIEANSDQILTTNALLIQNSAMIITHSERLDHNSNKIMSNMNTIMENSNQILQTVEDVAGNSNQVLTTNALAVGNSDQLLTTSALSIQNSAMIIAHSERIDQNSNQLVVVNQLSIDNSNAITVLQGATSVLAEQNSNQILSILDDIATNSNQILATNGLAIGNSDQILTTSTLSIQNSVMIITHSERLDHNSNKIISNMNIIMENSNQILQTVEDVVGNSNQILDVRVLAVANSDQILTTSALSIQNSAMIITHSERIDQNSNQLVVVNQLSIDNSNAVAALQGATSVLAEQNSNQILSLLDDIEANSNQILTTSALATQNSAMAIANADSIAIHDTFIGSIDHGPGDIVCADPTMTLSYDLFLSHNHKLLVTSDCVLDGSTHRVHLALTDEPLIRVIGGSKLTFKNVVLQNVSADYLDVTGGSTVLFGDGVVLELAGSIDHAMSWSFIGDATINGRGNELVLGNGSGLALLTTATLTLQNLRLAGLGGALGIEHHNLRMLSDDAHIVVQDSDLVLSSNYSITTGNLDICGLVGIRGAGNTFAYATSGTLRIKSQAHLLLDHGVRFSYDVPSALKTGVVFDDISSAITFNAATLHTTQTGIRFANGTLIIDDAVSWVSEAQSDAEAIEIASSLNVCIRTGAVLNVDGPMRYE